MVHVKRIAIDGPAASGKSTIGTHLAEHLGYLFVDTGILYRSLTDYFLTRCPNLNLQDEPAVSERVKQIHISVEGHAPLRILLDDAPAGEDLHTDAINRTVPVVAAYPAVRKVVRQIQAQIARMEGVIIAGRDIGTIVLPDADLKLFLDVSLEERAERRYQAISQTQPGITREQVLDDLRQRDRLDTTRVESPLRVADDALVIMTDGLTVVEVLAQVLEAVQIQQPRVNN